MTKPACSSPPLIDRALHPLAVGARLTFYSPASWSGGFSFAAPCTFTLFVCQAGESTVEKSHQKVPLSDTQWRKAQQIFPKNDSRKPGVDWATPIENCSTNIASMTRSPRSDCFVWPSLLTILNPDGWISKTKHADSSKLPRLAWWSPPQWYWVGRRRVSTHWKCWT